MAVGNGQLARPGQRCAGRVWADAQPIRPYVPAMAKFLIVVTFLEDALRIITQWGDQLWYLQKWVSSARHQERMEY